ncbi:MAG: hypothetical protein ACR2P5_02980 [Gammaproteobacteria bacterium]
MINRTCNSFTALPAANLPLLCKRGRNRHAQTLRGLDLPPFMPVPLSVLPGFKKQRGIVS